MTIRDTAHSFSPNDPSRDSSDDMHDPIAQYFAKRGVSENVRRKGLRGIVAQWEAIAQTAARYDLTLDDWLNDVDLRDIIHGAMAVAPDRQRKQMLESLNRADAMFRAGTVETRRPLWGDTSVTSDAHDPELQWWYFRRPADPGETMRADLANAGIV